MKKIKFLFLVAGILLVADCASRAAILLGNLSPVTTAQTNTSTFVTATANINLPQVTVSNNALSATNSYSGYFRWSFDGVNFYTNSSPTFNPATNAAGSSTISPQTISVPIYVQMLAITNTANTSAIQLGVTSP